MSRLLKVLLFVVLMMSFLCSTTGNAQTLDSYTDSLKIALTADSLDRAFDNVFWRYSLVDDSAAAAREYNDREWKLIRAEDLDSTVMQGIGWFRLRFSIDSTLTNKPIAFAIRQRGASEIYLDGKLIKRYGKIKGKDSSVYYDPKNVPVILVMDSVGEHTLAVRYARYHFDGDRFGISINMEEANNAIEMKRVNDIMQTAFLIVLFVVFLTLSLLHLLFFLYYKQNVSNLWFSIFMFCIASIWISIFWSSYTNDSDWSDKLMHSVVVFASVACSSFLLFIYILFNNKGKWWMVIALLLSAAALFSYFTNTFDFGITITVLLGYSAVYSIISLLRAIIRKIEGAMILGVGFGFFMVSLFCVILLAVIMEGLEFNTSNGIIGAILAVILLLDIVSIPITMSVYQAWMFAKLNKDLTTQLQQVKDLSETTIKQEQEKKHILENQNVQLEQMVSERTSQLKLEKQKSDELLLNILPEGVAEELKKTGSAEAKQYNHVSVLFTDFVNFTGLSEQMTPKELVLEIHRNFTAFDAIIEKHGLEKIKTIGDAYMAVCGLPNEVNDHAQRVVKAAFEIRDYMAQSGSTFKIRMGIHTGAVVAGIVGVKKYAYDIWGDTVNTAARMEQNSESGKINISGTTYELVKEEFVCEHRGKIPAKNKGEIDMYFVVS